MARTLYNLGGMREEIWIEYLAEELARNRTRRGISRVRYLPINGRVID